MIDWDEARYVPEVAALLCRVPELSQTPDGIILEDLPGGRTRVLPSSKLRHYISSVCILVSSKGNYLHLNDSLVSRVRHLRKYPGLRISK